MQPDSTKTVLFIGDSITHAHRRPGEAHDCYQLGSGYANSVASELSAGDPGGGWEFANRGECGDTVQHLASRWDADCLAAAPGYISILIGINDARAADVAAEQFRSTYQQLLDRTRSQLARTRLMLLEPFGLTVKPRPDLEVASPGQLDRLAVLRPIVAELAAGAGASFIPLQSLFDRATATSAAEVWTCDGIHPSAAGHWLIARAWTAAARQAGWFGAVNIFSTVTFSQTIDD